MRIISLNQADFEDAVHAAVLVLEQGGVIAIPTETTYGLSCDPRNAKAVGRIFSMKGRDPGKAMLLVASSFEQVQEVAILSEKSLALAREFWPGPLTLILPAVNGQADVAIRISSSPMVQLITKRFGYPIISTSANHSGKLECRTGKAVEEVFTQSSHQPDLLLDVGALPTQNVSTIARVLADGTVEVLRQGAVQVPSKI